MKEGTPLTDMVSDFVLRVHFIVKLLHEIHQADGYMMSA